MSIAVQMYNKERLLYLRVLCPSLELLAAQRQPGHSSRIWFHDLVFGSPLELAVITSLAYTLDVSVLTLYLPGDKDTLRGAVARFLRRNEIQSTAELLRFLSQDAIREELTDLSLGMLRVHKERGNKS